MAWQIQKSAANSKWRGKSINGMANPKERGKF
jgi:hypothetical protein